MVAAVLASVVDALVEVGQVRSEWTSRVMPVCDVTR